MPRKHQVEDEDAATLKLGSEFNNAGCLMISEVKTLLEFRAEKSGKIASETAVFKNTKSYVDTFSKFNDDTSRSVREALTRHVDQGLTQFEIAQLANLIPASAEEAKNCIPSLILKLDDDQLQEILDEIQAMHRSQTR
ncbi:RNA polymerase B [Tulasnella sp. 330]|nr:RNA polymerase B [Tulasnella sp. 330]KAG8883422.1 RNA polymerase B [Tulasnella sp. 331]KAG8887463.1 RNA polymerase B [Tulasnella sp. 332]